MPREQKVVETQSIWITYVLFSFSELPCVCHILVMECRQHVCPEPVYSNLVMEKELLNLTMQLR